MMSWILIIHIIFVLTIIPLGVVVNTQLYQNVKLEKRRENGKIVQQILKTYSIVQCTLPAIIQILMIPFLDIALLEKLDHTLMSIIAQTFRFVGSLYIFYTGFNSLIIACARYMFIVFSRKADKIGIRKLKFFFICSSIFLPLCLVILRECIFSIKEIQIQRLIKIQEQKCGQYLSSNNNSVTECIDTMISSMEFPLYEFIQGNFNSTLISIIRAIIIFVSSVIVSNLLELFIYIHTFIFCMR